MDYTLILLLSGKVMPCITPAANGTLQFTFRYNLLLKICPHPPTFHPHWIIIIIVAVMKVRSIIRYNFIIPPAIGESTKEGINSIVCPPTTLSLCPWTLKSNWINPVSQTTSQLRVSFGQSCRAHSAFDSPVLAATRTRLVKFWRNWLLFWNYCPNGSIACHPLFLFFSPSVCLTQSLAFGQSIDRISS